jgi:HD-GYP domain-containing protein (c-di-GMP phosphodiesterase class II)
MTEELTATTALESADQNPHYVRAVTEMGENREIVASEDIHTASGMKLLARGASVDRRHFDILSKHKLRAPLDVTLSVKGAIDAVELAFEANRLLASDSTMAALAERSGDALGFRQCLGSLRVPPAVGFRLTVMRQMRAELFQHSLRIALICYAIGVRLKLSAADLKALVLAALCHDLGELHTDPALLAPGHRVSVAERRFIHVHPVTAYVLLCEVADVPVGVLQAVLQHHERLDGSGYPGRLAGDAIHPLARILCVVEATEGLVRRADARRVDVVLRLNHARFDPRVADILRDLLPPLLLSEGGAAGSEGEAGVERLTHLARVFEAWPTLLEQLEQCALPASLGFIAERMQMLYSSVHNAGISPQYAEALVEIAREDHDVAVEMAATLAELSWLMNDIANEIERHTDVTEGEAARLLADLIGLLRPPQD